MSKKVYYDDSCYVCSLEINAVRKRGEACGIQFVDISSPDFGNPDRDFETEMIGEFDGKVTVGVETFRRMYEEMGYNRSVCFSRLPVVRSFFNLGYHVFAYYIRPHLPKRRRDDEPPMTRDVSDDRESDFIDYDGMGNQGRFVNKEEK